MTLSLPEDLEPFVSDYDEMQQCGVYCLELERPLDLQEKWDRLYDHRPPYWTKLKNAKRVFYVGGASNLLSRLEDHRDGDVRLTALTRVCEIRGLHTAWPHDGGVQEVFDVLEPRVARALQESMPNAYIHQR